MKKLAFVLSQCILINSNAYSTPINVYDASLHVIAPTRRNRGTLLLKNGEKTKSAKLLEQFGRKDILKDVFYGQRNISKTLEFYQQNFQQDSYDNEGSTLHVIVNLNKLIVFDFFGLRNNAMWMQNEELLVFGAGHKEFSSFAKSIDIVAHEFTHAIISHTSNLKYVGQSGAINEHLADVFGEFVEQKYENSPERFLIGEKLINGDKPLRNMLDPHEGYVWLPAHMSEIPERLKEGCRASGENDNCGVHILSGILNKVAALYITKVGYQNSYDLYFNVMTKRLSEYSQFIDYKEAMLEECRDIYHSENCQELKTSFAAVGL